MDGDQPLVTLTLYTYNQQEFVYDAVLSALRQTYQPLQIIISDDCSTDNTVEVVQRAISEVDSVHEVLVNVNETNLGILRHLNKIVPMARGQFIVGGAGDDVSDVTRVERLVKCWRARGVSAVFSNARLINEQSRSLGNFYRSSISREISASEMVMAGHAGVLGASLSYEKSIFGAYGVLPEDGPYEDQIIPFKSAITDGLFYLDEPLLSYRVHKNNVSAWTAVRTAEVDKWLEIRKRQLENSVSRYKYWSRLLTLSRYELEADDVLDKKICIHKLELNCLSSPFFLRLRQFRRLLQFVSVKKDFFRCSILVFSPMLYRFILIKKSGTFR